MLIKDRFTILIVDDCLEDRETYHRYLQRDLTISYDLHLATYAREGLQLCQTTWPDAILLDFLLPDLNGLEFIDALKTQAGDRELPAILVLTGQGDIETAVTLMKQGVQDYAIKNNLTQSDVQSLVHRNLERVKSQRLLQIQQQLQQVLAEVALNIRRSLKLEDILATAVNEIKQFLTCDRVVIYQFDPNWIGTIVAEAVEPPYTASIDLEIVDTCFQENHGVLYQQGRREAVADIDRAGFSVCHIELLEQFQVRACLVVPILLTPDVPTELPRLWGLLIAHQCQSTRDWSDMDALFLDRISVQLAIGIQQAELLTRLDRELTRRSLAEANLREQTIIQRQWLQELTKTTALLKQRNQELDSFVSIASHDLRAPLRAIRNLATWLAEDLTDTIDTDSQQQFSLLTSRVSQMELLLEDLLQYAQLGRTQQRLTPVPISELIEDIVRGLDLPPALTIDFAPDLPTITTNATALEQVLTNTIGNAVKHHDRPDGRVEIRVTALDDGYRFEVIDDGPGIPPEHHQTMFEIFRTFSKVPTADSTGIGLAIVKKIVELQGGTISLESAVGEGTTLGFTWPLVSDLLAVDEDRS
jgi:signal transduction histidine kinase/DNA-binding NarL/FixJ family response regulator